MTHRQIATVDHLAKAVGITAEMIERRNFLRGLYGAKFDAKIAEPKRILKELADRTGQPLIQVALAVAQRANNDGQPRFTVSLIIAALVELMEGGS